MVICQIRSWEKQGGMIVLVVFSSQYSSAEAEVLPPFDDVACFHFFYLLRVFYKPVERIYNRKEIIFGASEIKAQELDIMDISQV
ncbi:hypothetical protein TorRG33x02_007800 [Trema orientale]|uniref:Uncharacterized protein n=1 Tax=Trema orientale TaxID=63057 RepID=A0A2P5G0L5_TREOI|nr:hypothetical protein TorRG33x02_007800 [Trema orientale]